MDNEELLVDLLAYANKFINSQYECNISIGEVSYKNIDLLVVYKIEQLYKLKMINENERNHLLDLHYKKILLEKQLDAAITEEEQDSIDNKLVEICEELIPFGLDEELSIEYLISNTLENRRNIAEPINVDSLDAMIRIGDILRNEYGLSIKETAECLSLNKDMLIFNTSSKENLEFFLHMDFRFWARVMYDEFFHKKSSKDQDSREDKGEPQRKLIPNKK